MKFQRTKYHPYVPSCLSYRIPGRSRRQGVFCIRKMRQVAVTFSLWAHGANLGWDYPQISFSLVTDDRAFWWDCEDFLLSFVWNSDHVALPHGKRGRGGGSAWHSTSCSAYPTVLLLHVLRNDSLAEICPDQLLYYQNSFFHYKKQFQ